VLVVILALFKFPPFGAIFIGALVGGVLAVFVAPERVIVFAGASDDTPTWLALLKGSWLALANGDVPETGYPAIAVRVSCGGLGTCGGMDGMQNTIWLVIAALALGGVVEKAGVLARLITPIINAAKSVGALIISVVFAVLATNIVTADQYMAVVLPARMFKKA